MLSRQKIQKPAFEKWDKKYVKVDEAINIFLASRGYKQFDPYSMDDNTTEDLIRFLKLAPTADQVEIEEAAAARQRRAQRLTLSMSALSLLLSLGALAVSMGFL